MTIQTLTSFQGGAWTPAAGDTRAILSAINGETIAQVAGQADVGAMVDYAKSVGGPALRAMSFHERATMIKELAKAMMAGKDALYELSYQTGATKADSWIDIEGGAGTLFAYASKGKRELPNAHVLVDGDAEMLSREGSFIGQHIYTPLKGVAIHINAYNFPIWGMLEKLGPTLLAGVPAIVKPATSTAYLAEAAFKVLLDAGVLPGGALQFIAGGVGDMFDHLDGQDSIAFTGSAATATLLQGNPKVAEEAIKFTAERDSLNASILGPDAAPGTPEFDLFIKEVAKEMTVKAGQKCTAIRRAVVPATYLDAAQEALVARLGKTTVGDPRVEGVRMGALASKGQLQDVREKVSALSASNPIVFGALDSGDFAGDGTENGAFISPILMRCERPWDSDAVHDVEAFGPVSTLMPYSDEADAVALANRGKGSLAISLFTHDNAAATNFVMGSASHHGRMVLINRDCAKESTGHGSPLPQLVHGGPGRAGGGEEMGGIRGVKHYMQRTALQGSPGMLTKVVGQYLPGAPKEEPAKHLFRYKFGELHPGMSITTKDRTVTLDDIEHFAHFTGDTFYAHMDEEAAAASPIFGGRVAHGYLILSFAAGLFVDPAPGPVLANYGLEGLRFIKPLAPGETMKATLTVKSKSQRNEEMGEVKWRVDVTSPEGELYASYDLLTMNEV
ncbi:MAG: phenylacetic acid degradation bifunctional protein PaaZ [Pseudomonadota bacterium]